MAKELAEVKTQLKNIASQLKVSNPHLNLLDFDMDTFNDAMYMDCTVPGDYVPKLDSLSPFLKDVECRFGITAYAYFHKLLRKYTKPAMNAYHALHPDQPYTLGVPNRITFPILDDHAVPVHHVSAHVPCTPTSAPAVAAVTSCGSSQADTAVNDCEFSFFPLMSAVAASQSKQAPAVAAVPCTHTPAVAAVPLSAHPHAGSAVHVASSSLTPGVSGVSDVAPPHPPVPTTVWTLGGAEVLPGPPPIPSGEAKKASTERKKRDRSPSDSSSSSDSDDDDDDRKAPKAGESPPGPPSDSSDSEKSDHHVHKRKSRKNSHVVKYGLPSQTFLGMCGWFRKHINWYAQISAPMAAIQNTEGSGLQTSGPLLVPQILIPSRRKSFLPPAWPYPICNVALP